MTFEEIASSGLEIIANVVKLRNAAQQKVVIPGLLTEVKALPNYYPEYHKEVAEYMAGKLHRDGEFPEELFSRIKPLQSPDEYLYMRSIYEAITRDVVFEFGNTIKKSLVNGSIEFPKSEGGVNDFEEYLTNEIENFNSLMLWAESAVDTKLIDGNALAVAWPSQIEKNESGVIIGDVKCQPLVYPVVNVVYRQHDGQNWHYIVESEEKSYVKSGNSTEKIGTIYRYIGPEFCIQYDQTGEKSDNKFEITLQFEHEIGYTPATRMKGIAQILEGNVYYSSILSLALPHLNNAVIDATGLAQVKAKVMYPTRILIDEPCDFTDINEHCENGYIRYFDADLDQHINKQCPSCHGTGWKRNVGISSEIRINPRSKVDENDVTVLNANNVMAYVSPPTESAKFLREEIDMAIVSAERKLHLRSEPRESGDISATEKNRDKENTEAFIKPISNQIWDILSFIIDAMGKMMYGKESYERLAPTLYYPDSFDMITTEDIVEMMAEAQERKLPTIMKQGIMSEYLTKDSESSPKEAMKMQLIFRSDRLIAQTMDEAALMLSRNVAGPWEVFLHANPGYIVDLVLRERPNLYNDMEAAVLAVHLKAQELTPTNDALPTAIEPPIA